MRHQFDKQDAEFALTMVDACIEAMQKDGCLSLNGFVLVLKPDANPTSTSIPKERNAGTVHSAFILATRCYGNQLQWPLRYDEVAYSKALLTAKHKKPTRDILVDDREAGETLFFGSVIVDENIIFACSGYNANFDEFLSYVGAYALRARCLIRTTTQCFK